MSARASARRADTPGSIAAPNELARALFWITAAFVVALVLLVPARPAGLKGHYDVAQFVAWMRSPIVGGDLDFTDDVRPAENALPHTITGRTHNAFPLGGPLLWSPFYALAHAGTLAVRGLDGALPADGYSGLYQAATHAGVFAIGIGGLLVVWLAARRIASRGALPAVMVSWLAGFGVFYTHVDPFHAHGTAFATSSLFVASWLWWRREGESPAGGVPDTARALFMGLAGGLATLTRWQAAAMWVLVAADAWRPGRRRQAALAAAVGALVFLPQLVAWQILYGAWWRPPRGEFAGVFVKWASPRIIPVLFSSWHGLLHWHPVLVLGVIGLVVLSIRRPRLGLPMLAAFVIQLYVNSVVMDWWASGSFGHRRFDVALPLLVVGMCAVWPTGGASRRIAAGAGGALVALNVLAAVAYTRGTIPQATPVPLNRIVSESLRLVVQPGQLFDFALSVSWWKVTWIVLGVTACGVAWLGSATVHRPARTTRSVVRIVATGTAACVVVGGALWAIRGRPAFDPYTFEARLLAPAPVLTRSGHRTLQPGTSAFMYLYVLPGFLPQGVYRPEVVRPPAELSTDVRVTIEERTVARGAAVRLRNGWYELRVTNDGLSPVEVESVRLEPARAKAAFAPEPLDVREHLR